jgi:hypothetical protein
MATIKNRMQILLDDLEREKLQKLARSYGVSLSKMIGILIRKADLDNIE